MVGFEEGYKFFVDNSSAIVGAEMSGSYVGTVDEEIKKLINDLNSLEGFKTSSKMLKGDVAEFWHSRTFNIKAALDGSDHRAFVDRSHDFASTDISTNFGDRYGLKFYSDGQASANSLGSGQVLHCPYTFEKAKLVVREMTDLLVLDLVDKGLVTDQIVLTIGYDIENLTDPGRSSRYKGEITTDHYGRKIPKHAHGTANLDRQTSSTMLIMNAVTELYDQIVDKNLLVRRITISANHIVDESSVTKKDSFEQLNLFVDYEEQQQKQAEEDAALEREKNMQKAMLSIKKKFGKNAILKGMNLEEGATAKDRNSQIGGHKA